MMAGVVTGLGKADLAGRASSLADGLGTGHMMEDWGDMASSNPVLQGTDIEDEDEALAAAARARYRKDGIIRIEPDGGLRSALGTDEGLLAVRQTASIERLADGGGASMSGRLAITTQRLMLVHSQPLTLASLDELDDITVVRDRLLVTLTSGTGFFISVPRPRLLRVELAEARASRKDRSVDGAVEPGL